MDTNNPRFNIAAIGILVMLVLAGMWVNLDYVLELGMFLAAGIEGAWYWITGHAWLSAYAALLFWAAILKADEEESTQAHIGAVMGAAVFNTFKAAVITYPIPLLLPDTSFTWGLWREYTVYAYIALTVFHTLLAGLQTYRTSLASHEAMLSSTLLRTNPSDPISQKPPRRN